MKDLEPLATCGAAADDNHRMDRGQCDIAWRFYLVLLIFLGYQMRAATDCSSSGEAGEITFAYHENVLIDPKGKPQPIKRHYEQTVAGSPIGTEGKIEFDTDEVIWLHRPMHPGHFPTTGLGRCCRRRRV